LFLPGDKAEGSKEGRDLRERKGGLPKRFTVLWKLFKTEVFI
jgi:hypothetical protein